MTGVQTCALPISSTSRIKASRIVEKDSTTVDAEGVALRSRLTAISGTTLSLTINGVAVTVDASTATLSPSGVTLAVGDVVRVVVDPTVTANGFALSTIAGGSGTANLTATKVSVKRERHGDGTRSVVRGAITTISGSTWTINGVTVDVSQSPTLIEIGRAHA